MHSRFGMRGALAGGLLALAIAAFVPTVASAKPEPGVKRSGFRLFARSLGAMTINRVYCGLSTSGEVCVDSTNSSTIGGGFWPKGTGDQYVFNTGLQLAGIIGGSKPANPWGGDTTGAFFFNARGDNVHGQEIRPIFNATNPDDVANWPEAGLVPSGDDGEDIFYPVLRGRVSASQGDVWFMSWEGDPSTGGGRPHPMGIAVEARGMGWNYPTGNEDIIYFVYTFYNVTSLNPDDYASVRPSVKEILVDKARQFHALNNAEYGVDLPDDGYPITNLFAAFGADMDVGSAGDNYSTVELPFALGNTYQKDFGQPNTWTFDAGIFASPFFKGVGFVGVKYLKSPTGPGAIQLFGNTINGGAFGDARNTTQLYRYLSGNISTAAGDAPCTTGDPTITHICYVNNTSAADMRFFQSSTPLSLAPGQFGSIVVAYIFAPPVAVKSFAPGTDLKPGDPRVFSDVAALTTPGAVNMVDSIAGFLKYEDKNTDGVAQQDEYTVVPGSLLGKAQVAQQVFDSKFLLAFAPDSPQFFLVPGDNQVTVLWRPSPSDAATPGSLGDPFFEIASSPMVTPEGGGAPVVNSLYDPNYRQFDVEGYRVYRGRVDAPNSLTLLAQFDYSGTSIKDFSGFVNPSVGCAPDIGIFAGCPDVYDPATFQPGVARTGSVDVPLVGPIVQVKAGQRAALGTGVIDTVVSSIDSTTTPGSPDTTFAVVFVSQAAQILAADTAVTGGASGFPGLSDTGVPFVYVDRTVRNNFRYFYSVTAFDVNSFASGPSSIESARITKAVTPHVAASNSSSEVATTQILVGRGVTLNQDAPLPTFDPATSTFSGPFPPADGWSLDFIGAVSQVLNGSGQFTARLDSIQLGNATGGVDFGSAMPNTYFLTANTSAGTTHISVALGQDFTQGLTEAGSTSFPAASLDPGGSAKFGGSSAFALYGQVGMKLAGEYWTTLWGRSAGLGDGDPILAAANGPRWFVGDNETMANPNANFAVTPAAFTDWSNAGSLPDVTVIHTPMAYLQSYSGTGTRDFLGMLGGAVRAADYKFYWGEAGAVDSVIDITHNVPVPFDTAYGGGWGFLTPASQVNNASDDANTGVVSYADFLCVYPAPQQGFGHTFQCGAAAATAPYKLVNTAAISPIQIARNVAGISAAPPPGQTGFGLYMPGYIFVIGTATLPAKGTVWTLRSYIGGITADGTFAPQPRTFSAIGAEVGVSYQATNALAAPTLADLDRVHTVPDPYYITNEYEQSADVKILKFVNLPSACTIRIYSSSGVLVDVIEHNSNSADGTETWNLQNRNHQVVASGVYFYHIEAGDARRVGRFTVVNFAQ